MSDAAPCISLGPDLALHCHAAQEDVFIPTLSVWETLSISTDLRLPGRGLSAADRDALMDDSLQSMGLHRKKFSQARRHLPSPSTISRRNPIFSHWYTAMPLCHEGVPTAHARCMLGFVSCQQLQLSLT
jgi:hypothetical protein